MSDLEFLKQVQENVNEWGISELENVSKRGVMVIPRGLSDEEVMKRYHDEEANHSIDVEETNKIRTEIMRKMYEALGLPFPNDVGYRELSWSSLDSPF